MTAAISVPSVSLNVLSSTSSLMSFGSRVERVDEERLAVAGSETAAVADGDVAVGRTAVELQIECSTGDAGVGGYVRVIDQ